MRALLVLLRLSPLLLCSGVVGCATWDAPNDALNETQLPPAQLGRDSVLFEVELVRVPEESRDELQALWKDVDEQYLEHDLRRHLAENGLRCGLIGSPIPGILRQWLDAEKPPLEQVAEGNVPKNPEVFGNYRRLECRPGREKKVSAAPLMKGREVVLVRDQNRLKAQDFEQAQGMFSLMASPLGDGRVRLQLTPLIEHGDVRTDWVPAQGTLVINQGRDYEEFEGLQFDATLSPGETLIVTGTPELKGVGGFFFGKAVGQGDRSLMLIRLAHSQHDKLFSPKRPTTPLTTPVD